MSLARRLRECRGSKTHSRRLMRLAEMAEMAAFIASGKASGMTGTTINLTMGTPKRHQPSHKEVDRHVKEFSQTFGLRLNWWTVDHSAPQWRRPC